MKAAAFYLAVAGAYAGAVSIALTAWAAAFHGWTFPRLPQIAGPNPQSNVTERVSRYLLMAWAQLLVG